MGGVQIWHAVFRKRDMTAPKDSQDCEAMSKDFYKPLPQQFELSGEQVAPDFFKNAVQAFGVQQEQQ